MTVPNESILARRFRFTLRTLLIAIACVAIAVALFLAYRAFHENQLLRQENARLRNEVGEIHVEPGDEDKVHAVKVRTPESLHWKWRLFIPTGRTFYLYMAGDNIPDSDQPPKNFSKMVLSPGEQGLDIFLRKDANGRWTWFSELPSTTGGFSAGGSELTKLIDAHNYGTTATGVTDLTKVEPGHDLQLLRLRFLPQDQNGGVNSSQLNTAGLGTAVWISEQ